MRSPTRASRLRGCAFAVVATGILLGLAVVALSFAVTVYSHRGAGAARASYLRQRKTTYIAVGAVSRPPLTRHEAIGDDVVQPYDAKEAEKGFVRARTPFGELVDFFSCGDGCASPWEPHEGVSVRQNLRVNGMSPTEVCNIESGFLATSPFRGAVHPTDRTSGYPGAVCAFEGTYEGAFVTVGIRGFDGSTVSVDIAAATRDAACYTPLEDPPLRRTVCTSQGVRRNP